MKGIINKILLCAVLTAIERIQGEQVIECDSINVWDWNYREPTLTCFMNFTVFINDPKTTIKSDQKAAGLRIVDNLKVQFVPIEIGKVFPTIEIMDICRCSISEIGPEHFDGMSKLQSLFLCNNQITHIPPKTFTSLKSMTNLDLSKSCTRFLIMKRD
jgi:Leucine rich repeat